MNESPLTSPLPENPNFDLPSQIQPAEGRHGEITNRISLIRKFAEDTGANFPENFRSDQHYWFLVAGSYDEIRREQNEYLAQTGVEISKKDCRELAIRSATREAGKLFRTETDRATDFLTGAWSRGSLDNRIRLLQKDFIASLDHPKSVRRLMVLYFLDIDNFKQYNDKFGHIAGDKVLVNLTKSMQKRSRALVDMVARYGGDEFAVLKVMNQDQLEKRAADNNMSREEYVNLQAELFRKEVAVENGIGISMGVCEVDLNEDVDEVYRRADELMYQSKQNGRNRTFSPQGEVVSK